MPDKLVEMEGCIVLLVTVIDISSYSDLRRRKSVNPSFILSCAIRTKQLRSRLPYPTGGYTSPSGAVVVGQGALSPSHRQSPPTTSNFGSASPASAGARAEQSRPVSVAGLPAPSPPPPASGLPPARTGGTSASTSSSISQTPRKRYTVALLVGEFIMKPHSLPSLPPIFVSDEDVDSDDAEEEDCVDRTISLVGQHTSRAA
ncbi:hypothetical protein BGY98DRAFT_931036 [Russula aff. rugulosa BPL654]|nr:hypothetical protein BGY98DRAFT_931036 [Russula aff. rugulosa BPL654]